MIKWAKRAMWAPCVVKKGEEYFMFFTANNRETCIDRMEFNPDGTIKPVKMTLEGPDKRPL